MNKVSNATPKRLWLWCFFKFKIWVWNWDQFFWRTITKGSLWIKSVLVRFQFQLEKVCGPNVVDRRVCGRITQIRSYLWHDSIRQLLLKILYNSWLCLLLVALGSIPKLCQHMYWVGGVRKMAIFADIQYICMLT